MLIEFCDATDVFVIGEKRLSPSSGSKAGSEDENAGVADAGAGCAELDWNLTGCCKTLRYGRVTVLSEPGLLHCCGKFVDEVVEAG